MRHYLLDTCKAGIAHTKQMAAPNLLVQLVFPAKIVVDRCDIAAGSGGKIANTCGLEAMLAEKLFRRVE
ncbi:hypothetical protein ES703_93827 [subsurface metagenome]